ncbi:hypothetical protein ABPG73_022892 [Tetrahymena malaccensis]
MKDQGYTYTDIEDVTQIYRGTISKQITCFEENNDVLLYNKRSKAIYNQKLNENNKNTLFILQITLQEDLNMTFNQSTISRYENQISKFKLLFEILIFSEQNQQKRHDCFQVCRANQKVFIFKNDANFKKPKQNISFSVKIWGELCRKVKIGIKFIENTLNKEKYINLLLNEFFPSIPDAKYRKSNWRFFLENAPRHKANMVQDWLISKIIRVFHHPHQSPDLSIIELVWSQMKRYLQRKSPSNKKHLIELIKESLDNLTLEQINNYIGHLQNQADKVIVKKGQFIS